MDRDIVVLGMNTAGIGRVAKSVSSLHSRVLHQIVGCHGGKVAAPLMGGDASCASPGFWIQRPTSEPGPISRGRFQVEGAGTRGAATGEVAFSDSPIHQTFQKIRIGEGEGLIPQTLVLKSGGIRGASLGPHFDQLWKESITGGTIGTG